MVHYWKPTVLVIHMQQTCWSMAIVLNEVVSDMSYTSGHLECASTAIKNVLPINGPAKSTWTHYHGLVGQIHGCRGATSGDCFTDWHEIQDFAIFLSSPGHHIWHLARLFILDTPGWSRWSSDNIVSYNFLGIMTHIPQSTYPPSTFNWFLLI